MKPQLIRSLISPGHTARRLSPICLLALIATLCPIASRDPQPIAAASNDAQSIITAAGDADQIAATGPGGDFFPAPGSPLSVSGDAFGMTTGDFNGDDAPDLATIIRNHDQVGVLLGNGAGAFAAPRYFPIPTGSQPQNLVAGDFNGDGRPDLATANTVSNTVSLLLGEGDGDFGPPANFAVGLAPRPIVAADFNRDGWLDLATGNFNAASVSILLNNQQGGFAAVTPPLVGGNPLGLVAGDFNNDTNPDLAVALVGLSQVWLLLGNGNGAFSVQTIVELGNGQYPRALAAGDFNRDGRLDAVSANNGGKSLGVLLGTTGGFSPTLNIPAGNSPFSVLTSDLDGDGVLDLTAPDSSGIVSVLLGDGSGGFGAPALFRSLGGSNDIETADVNRDGRPDLAIANGQAQAVSVLLNQPRPAILETILPPNINAGQSFNVSVILRDSAGEQLSNSQATVALTLESGPSGAILSGITTVRARMGVAAFSGLRLDRPSANYVLRVSVPGQASMLSPPFTVTSATAPTWLVLLYLSGDDTNITDTTRISLTRPMRALIGRLERMQYNPAVRLVVLYDGNEQNDTAIYVKEPDTLRNITDEAAKSWPGGIGSPGQRELDSGSFSTLRNFVTWARGTYSDARYSFLSIVDHGGGWAPDLATPPIQPRGGGGTQPSGGWRGMSLDLASGGSTLSTRGTGEALSGLGKFDVLFFDACLMGMIESAYEVRDYADYFIAGQNLLFAELPYQDYFSTEVLTAATTPRELAQRLVERYNAHKNGRLNPFTVAAIDLTRLRSTVPDNLASRVNRLAERLLTEFPAPVNADDQLVKALVEVYTTTQKFDYDSSLTLDPREGYVDLVDFARRLRDSQDPAISQAVKDDAAAVVSAAIDPAAPVIVRQRHNNGTYKNEAWNFDGANGLSIFLPLGEQDYRPTKVDPNNKTLPAEPERQLDYYVDADQLAFTRDVPGWAKLLERLEPAVPVIRAPGAPGGVSLSATTPLVDRRPFNAPYPLPVIEITHLPLMRR